MNKIRQISRWMILVGLFVFMGLSAAAGCDDGGNDNNDYRKVCEGIECSGHGVCAVTVAGDPMCGCDQGYYAEGLSCVEEGTTGVCAGITCSGHGVCADVNGLATCNCDEGYTVDGTNCIVEEDPCFEVDCSNHGTCEVVENAATCNCEEGYHLVNQLSCEEDMPDVPQDPVPTGTSYHFAEDGDDDTGDGSIENPFRTLDKMKELLPTLQPGDAILFAMGDTFRFVSQNMNDPVLMNPGTSKDPIIISRYWKPHDESNTTLPLLTGETTSQISFANQGGDIWVGENPGAHSTGAVRFLKDGDEQVGVETYDEFQENPEADIFVDGAKIYHRSSADPSGSTWTYSTAKTFLNLDCSYLIINGIEMQWSRKWAPNLELRGDHITLQNCKLGAYSHRILDFFGTITQRLEGSTIQYNTFDTMWRKDYWFDYISSSDGVGLDNVITIVGYADNMEIHHNDFIDFGHGGIIYWTGEENEVRSVNMQIRDNYFYAPHSAYARPFGTTGAQLSDWQIYRNIFDNCSTQIQIGGIRTHIHHNIFTNWNSSNKSNRLSNKLPNLISVCITTERTTKDMVIENNIFHELPQPAITNTYIKKNVTIQNNIFYNVCKEGMRTDGSSLRGLAVMLFPWGSTPSPTNITDTIKNNLFYNSQNGAGGLAVGVGAFDLAALVDEYSVSELNADTKYSWSCEANLEGDPHFVDLVEFRLHSDSPAIGTGIEPLSQVDYDENQISPPYNMGIYNTNE